MVRVALVVASHSDLLARGVVELAGQMAPDVRFEAAGGTDEGGIGTSFDRIDAAVTTALESVDDEEGAGVVILTDLGSATMTVESVLDFADDPDRLRFIDAPLVEGAVAAAVRAQVGDSLDEVAAAARGVGAHYVDGGTADAPDVVTPDALPSDADASDEAESEPEEFLEATAVIADPVGMHARPAALLARLAGSFDAEVSANGVDAASLLEIMTLGLVQGDTVHLRASGPQAQEALDALVDQIEGR
ncbi:dihydroxyacetone kinase phosphoryl donor subunit DhaM [Actinomyces mediterranea]|uniref:dihydroxyacetone kinase phosphoryl donor subunit DhaM n=1 Tax=Actinomyces mediterranea TaxID=1871028 RepID=UPI00196868EE|nr:dihydroxyacetone kinase phosphoryl donor subunit DhaM [Actinomyces mediterranea]